MISFKSRFVSIAAILLILYMAYQSFQNNRSVTHSFTSAQYSSHTIDIDAAKKKLNWYENLILHFSRDKIKQYQEMQSQAAAVEGEILRPLTENITGETNVIGANAIVK